MARLEKPFSWQTLDAILQYGATKAECCGYLEVSHDTLERRIKEDFSMTFTEYAEMKSARAKLGLRKKQWDMALAGNTTMMIWMGKQELGQSDKFTNPDPEVNKAQPVLLKYSIKGNKYDGSHKPDIDAEVSSPAEVAKSLPEVVETETIDEDTFQGD